MPIRINLSRCVMSGQCYYMYPELVRMKDDGYPEVIASRVANVSDETLRELIEGCPAMAIESVEEN